MHWRGQQEYLALKLSRGDTRRHLHALKSYYARYGFKLYQCNLKAVCSSNVCHHVPCAFNTWKCASRLCPQYCPKSSRVVWLWICLGRLTLIRTFLQLRATAHVWFMMTGMFYMPWPDSLGLESDVPSTVFWLKIGIAYSVLLIIRFADQPCIIV